MQVKVFAGKPEKVEHAINRWADDGSSRNVNMIVPMPPPSDGEVALMIVFTPLAPPATPPNGKIVPVSGIVH